MIQMLATYMHAALGRLHSDERGQDMLEWILLGGLIAAGIVGILGVFTGALNTMVSNVGDCIDFASATPCNPGF